MTAYRPGSEGKATGGSAGAVGRELRWEIGLCSRIACACEPPAPTQKAMAHSAAVETTRKCATYGDYNCMRAANSENSIGSPAQLSNQGTVVVFGAYNLMLTVNMDHP